MRTRFRQVPGMVAIIVIAMHTVLWGGTATSPAAAAVDPFSVVCHSSGDANAAPGQAPSSPASAPSHACDHCNLCGPTAPLAASPPAVVLQLLPNRRSHALEPAPGIPRGGIALALKGARGPPVFA